MIRYEGERQRHDEREARHQRELAASRALGLAHGCLVVGAHRPARGWRTPSPRLAISGGAGERKGRGRGPRSRRGGPHETIFAGADDPRGEGLARSRFCEGRVAELESELASGGHEHRKFVEIAERQAAQGGALASEAAQSKLATSRLKRAIRDRDSEVADLASQLLACQKKLEDARRGLGRDATNLEYVKNLLVQYFSLRQNSSEQRARAGARDGPGLHGRRPDLLRAQAQKWEASQSYWGGSSEPDAPNPLPLTLTTLAPAAATGVAVAANTGT